MAAPVGNAAAAGPPPMVVPVVPPMRMHACLPHQIVDHRLHTANTALILVIFLPPNSFFAPLSVAMTRTTVREAHMPVTPNDGQGVAEEDIVPSKANAEYTMLRVSWNTMAACKIVYRI